MVILLAAFVWGICSRYRLIVRGKIGGGVCLPKSQVNQNLCHRFLDLMSDTLLFGRSWYGGPNAASNPIEYAKFRS
ncbi:MAG: hypothetical protein DME55_06180 [Verrucomicrobia bacterium]|nr:MAG: hypothetical protein DME55_06180 [Verrucomicrobiota bacterium]